MQGRLSPQYGYDLKVSFSEQQVDLLFELLDIFHNVLGEVIAGSAVKIAGQVSFNSPVRHFAQSKLKRPDPARLAELLETHLYLVLPRPPVTLAFRNSLIASWML
jgi:hypothetical protein